MGVVVRPRPPSPVPGEGAGARSQRVAQAPPGTGLARGPAWRQQPGQGSSPCTGPRHTLPLSARPWPGSEAPPAPGARGSGSSRGRRRSCSLAGNFAGRLFRAFCEPHPSPLGQHSLAQRSALSLCSGAQAQTAPAPAPLAHSRSQSRAFPCHRFPLRLTQWQMLVVAGDRQRSPARDPARGSCCLCEQLCPAVSLSTTVKSKTRNKGVSSLPKAF